LGIAKERELAHGGRGGKEQKIVKKHVLHLVQNRIIDEYSGKNKSLFAFELWKGDTTIRSSF
jgi:hypothetical protein